MRIIDKTPLISEDGKITFANRVKGTLQNGFSWYPELQSQQVAIAALDKHLDKNFTLLRNQALGKSDISLPLTLVGSSGVYILYVTHLKGMYHARSDSWGELSGNQVKPAKINLLTRTQRLARVLEGYLKQQGFEQKVEPILLSVDPGLHVESVRPLVRIVLRDAVQSFASGLMQAPPVLSAEAIHKLVEVIQTPISAKKAAPEPTPEPSKQDSFSFQEEEGDDYFKRYEDPAPSQDEGLGEIGFAFEEEEPRSATAEAPVVPRPEVAKPARKPASKKKSGYFGMTGKQFAILGGMAGVLVCVLMAFTLYILFTL